MAAKCHFREDCRAPQAVKPAGASCKMGGAGRGSCGGPALALSTAVAGSCRDRRQATSRRPGLTFAVIKPTLSTGFYGVNLSVHPTQSRTEET
jgi:hypothetical protein